MKTMRTTVGGVLILAASVALFLSPHLHAQGQALTTLPAENAGEPVSTQPPASGFVMLNNKVYLVFNGQALPVTEEKVLRVGSTGITDFNGRPLRLPPGGMLTLDGRVVQAPAGIKFTDGSPATTDNSPAPVTSANAGAGTAERITPPPPLGGNPSFPDRGVAGENLSGLAPSPSAAGKAVPPDAGKSANPSTPRQLPAPGEKAGRPTAPGDRGAANRSAAEPGDVKKEQLQKQPQKPASGTGGSVPR